jgi:hypothetical protein
MDENYPSTNNVKFTTLLFATKPKEDLAMFSLQIAYPRKIATKMVVVRRSKAFAALTLLLRNAHFNFVPASGVRRDLISERTGPFETLRSNSMDQQSMLPPFIQSSIKC